MTKARDIASAAPAPAGVTTTELGYVDGVTSAIQTQVDGKAATSHNHDATYINQSTFDAKGDLIVGTGNDAYARLGVGSTGDTIVADSSTATGLKWATPAAAGMTNPMTTTGDIIYSSPGSTPVRRGIGTTGQVLTVSGGVPVWASPAGGGKVLQVINATTTTQTVNTTGSYVDTTLTATITPSATSSRILVFVNQNGLGKQSTNVSVTLQLLRNSSSILVFEKAAGFTNTSAINFIGSSSTTFLDSPSTTSAVTYKTQFTAFGSTGVVQSDGTSSTITLMEIGA